MGETTVEDYQHMAACGIDVSTPPCSSSVDTAAVAATIALSGGTVEMFCCSACQTALIDAVATTADVEASQVSITDCRAARRSGVEVDSQVMLTGAEASSSKIASVTSNLGDTSTFQTNLQTAAA